MQTSGTTLISRREFCRRLGVSRAFTYDKASSRSPRFDPNFPKAVKLSGAGRSVGFVEAEVDAYIGAIVESSRSGAK